MTEAISTGRGDRSTAFLWAAWIAPPVLWLLELQTVYALTPVACRTGHTWILYPPVLVFLLLIVAAGALALGLWRRLGRGWPGDADGSSRARLQFLALLGMMNGALFGLIVFAHFIVTLTGDPCEGLRL